MIRVKATALISFVLLLMLCHGCGTSGAGPASIHLRVAGSTSMMPALTELAAAYSARHPEVISDIQGGGTLIGLQALRDGRAELAAASWKEEQPERSPDQLTWQLVARDGLALIVHPHNTLSDLSLEKARQVFAGWHAAWPDVGGKGGEIQVISREGGSGSRAVFEAGVMAGRRVSQTALVMPSSQAVVNWVATHPNAIGYVSMAYITTTVRAINIEGVAPTIQSVEDGSYPLVRELYLATRHAADRAVQEFVAFCLSSAGQAIMSKYHGTAG